MLKRETECQTWQSYNRGISQQRGPITGGPLYIKYHYNRYKRWSGSVAKQLDAERADTWAPTTWTLVAALELLVFSRPLVLCDERVTSDGAATLSAQEVNAPKCLLFL